MNGKSFEIPAIGSLAGLRIIRRHETQAELEERYGETMQDFRRDAAEDHDSDRESDDSGLDADSMADTEDGEDAE
jgi:hypothetical protein|tara:strand:- start:3428 stop:3652 length:225 start_codon:yes stop_codon:yes gene_type:complete